MKWTTAALTALAVLALAGRTAQAQVNLLVNGSLDMPGQHEQDLATGWTLTESPAGINTATFATFADHTGSGGVGLWYRGFEGTTFDNPREAVDADLYQTVPGVAGLKYTMTGWARFEANWAGGLDLLPSGGTSGPPRWPANTPSPTETIFALEFLDGGNAVLPGSVVVDLHDDLGQTNDGLWHQHILSAVAPAGTVNVRVRASMVDGVNADLNPQSAFVDDFSLTAIPEPGAMSMAVLASLGVMARRKP